MCILDRKHIYTQYDTFNIQTRKIYSLIFHKESIKSEQLISLF